MDTNSQAMARRPDVRQFYLELLTKTGDINKQRARAQPLERIAAQRPIHHGKAGRRGKKYAIKRADNFQATDSLVYITDITT